MSQFVLDTFTDADGTAIPPHVGELGATWTEWIYTGHKAVIESNRATPSGTGTTNVYASGTPASADYQVQAYVYVLSNLAGANPVLKGRMRISGSDTWYELDYIGGTGWQLYKAVNGSYTQLGSTFAQPTLDVGRSYRARLSIVGTTINCYVDNTLIIGPITDSAISAAGSAGFAFGSAGSATTGCALDNFQAGVLPPIPGTLSIISVSNTSIALSTGVAQDGTGPYTYQFQRSPVRAGFPYSWANIGSASATTTYTDSTVVTNTLYAYRVLITDNVSATDTSNVLFQRALLVPFPTLTTSGAAVQRRYNAQNITSGSVTLSDGAPLTTVSDSSGNGKDLTGTVPTEPIFHPLRWPGGRPCMSFSASLSTVLQAAAAADFKKLSDGSAYFALVIWRSTNATSDPPSSNPGVAITGPDARYTLLDTGVDSTSHIGTLAAYDNLAADGLTDALIVATVYGSSGHFALDYEPQNAQTFRQTHALGLNYDGAGTLTAKEWGATIGTAAASNQSASNPTDPLNVGKAVDGFEADFVIPEKVT